MMEISQMEFIMPLSKNKALLMIIQWDECMKWNNDVSLGINIDISHFQLISHRALGPVPTKVKEMP